MKRIFSALFLMLAIAVPAAARPISYADSWLAMQMNDGESNMLHLNYSPTAEYSIGYTSEYWREDKWWFNGAQLNWLVKRWNETDAQANLYVMSALGGATSDEGEFDDESDLAGFTII